MPDTPELQARFGQPSAQRPGCGFPVAKILALFLAGTGLLLEILATPLRSHEMARVSEVHPALKPSDVLVGDRGFCSFTHLVLLANRGVHAVLRMHQRQIVDFTPRRPHARPTDKRAPKGMPRSRWLQQLGVLDQVVEWFRREDPPEWMAQERFAALPETVILRELRYRVGRSGFRTPCVTLVTTLLDDEVYPLEALAEFYGMRWRVEQNLRYLKQTMKMDVLKCKTVEGILKELTVSAIVYNLVRVVMLEACARLVVVVERISFVDALRCLARAKADDELPMLIENPARSGRVEPRVVKQRPRQYSRMTKPRYDLRKHLKRQGLAAQMNAVPL
jgi:Transposase DDE domain